MEARNSNCDFFLQKHFSHKTSLRTNHVVTGLANSNSGGILIKIIYIAITSLSTYSALIFSRPSRKVLEGVRGNFFQEVSPAFSSCGFGMRDGSGARRGFSDVLLLGKPLEVCRHILIVVGCRNAAAVPHRIICPEGFLYPVQLLFPHSGGGQGSGIGTFP